MPALLGLVVVKVLLPLVLTGLGVEELQGRCAAAPSAVAAAAARRLNSCPGLGLMQHRKHMDLQGWNSGCGTVQVLHLRFVVRAAGGFWLARWPILERALFNLCRWETELWSARAGCSFE